MIKRKERIEKNEENETKNIVIKKKNKNKKLQLNNNSTITNSTSSSLSSSSSLSIPSHSNSLSTTTTTTPSSTTTTITTNRPIYTNKQRILIIASRGINARYRHLLEDLKRLLPHHKKDNKLDVKNNIQAINEIAEINSCNQVLYFRFQNKIPFFIVHFLNCISFIFL